MNYTCSSCAKEYIGDVHDPFCPHNLLGQKSITAEAEEIINGPRHDAYGDYNDEANKLAAFWSLITGQKIQPRHVPLMMVTLKVLREAHQHKRDNLIDIVGYTLLSEKLCHTTTSTNSVPK